VQDLARCVDQLHATEKTLEERTEWAQSLDRRIEGLERHLGNVQASRWIKIGRAFGLGPQLRQE